MNPPDLELLFRRFQISGDPKAIAAIYDQVAPELLLVAAHLGARQGDAEDLVQATFVAAMESCGAFDGGRRLMPWLIGILANHARRERRRVHRPGPEPGDVRPPGDPDPLHQAAMAEFADEFARRLRALPRAYRQVLTLRLVHGLGPLEIAHSLGLPPATVKTRLHRGRDILRRALPASLASSLVVGAASSAHAAGAARLAAVRDAVLRRAEELAALRPAAAAGVGAGTATPLLKASLAVGVLLAAGAAFFLAARNGRAPDATRAAAPVAETRTAAQVVAAERPAATATNPAPDATDATRAPASPEAGGAAADLDVVVRFFDGEPAPGAHVRIMRPDAGDPLLHERVVVADGEGRARVAALARGTVALAVHRGGGATPVEWAGVPDGAREPVTLTIPAGVDVRGRVLDAEGRPLPDAGIWVSRDGAPDEGRVLATTDARGLFHLRAVAPGRAIGAVADGYRPSVIRRVDAPDGGGSVEFTFALADSLSSFVLRGVVLGPDGAPLEHARVQIGDRLPYLDLDREPTNAGDRRPPAAFVTGADGRFERRGLALGFGEITVWARAPGCEPLRDVVRFDGPERDVTLSLRRGGRLEGTLVDAGGRAIAGATVTVRDTAVSAYALAPRWAETTAVSDAAGRFGAEGLGPQALRVFAVAPDESCAAGTVPPAVPEAAPDAAGTGAAQEPGIRRWDAVLAPPRSLEGLVTDVRGAPLRDLDVRALVPRGQTEPRPVTTDAYGRFAFTALADQTYTLWIADPRSAFNGGTATLPGLRAAARDETAAPIHVVVPDERRATASLRGRTLDSAGQPVRARIAVQNLAVGIATAWSDAATGRFDIGPLPPMTTPYDLYVEDAKKRWVHLAGVRPRSDRPLDLGDLVLDEPGRLRLTVAGARGQPAADVDVVVCRADGFVADAGDVRDGAYVTSTLAPGEYVLLGECSDAGVVTEVIAPTAFSIAAGTDLDVAVALVSSTARRFAFMHPDDGWDLRLDLTWSDATGTPLYRERVQLPHARPLAIERAFPAGTYHLHATSHLGRSAETAFRVEPGPAPAAEIALDLR